MSERCEVCDRPKYDPRAHVGLLTTHCAAHLPADPSDKLRPDCNAHRVDWRARALTAEQSLATSTNDLRALKSLYALAAVGEEALCKDLAAERERSGRLEADIAALAVLRTPASLVEWAKQSTVERARVARLEEVLREVMSWVVNWSPNFTEDGEWGATAVRVKAALTRNAAERGEAFAKSHDVADLLHGLPTKAEQDREAARNAPEATTRAGEMALRVAAASPVLSEWDRAIEAAAKACEAFHDGTRGCADDVRALHGRKVR